MIDEESKREVKQLVQAENWTLLGKLFQFTPKFVEYRGKRYFNWQSAPSALHRALGYKPPMFPPSDSPPTPKKINGHPKLKAVPRNIRMITYDQQEGRCFYCGCKVFIRLMTMDHLTPRSRGGNDLPENKRVSCANCNNAKSDMTLAEFLETDYLPEDRRKLLGAIGPATVDFQTAIKQQNRARPNAYPDRP